MTFQSGLVRSYQIISVRNRAIKGSGKNSIGKRKGVFSNYSKDTAALQWHGEQRDNEDPSTSQLRFFTSAEAALSCQINSILNTHIQHDTQLGNADGMSWNNNKCCPHSLKDIEITCCCAAAPFCTCLWLWRGKHCSLSYFAPCLLIWEMNYYLTNFYFWQLAGDCPHFSILWSQKVSTIQKERSTPTRKVLLSQ